MSKSKGNTVAPDDVIKEYGADTLRLYILSVAPPEMALEWKARRDRRASHRLIQRVWRLMDRHAEALAASRADAGAAPTCRRRPRAPPPQGPPDDPEGDRRHRRADPPEHRGRRPPRARERAVSPGGRARRPRPTAPALREALETLVLLMNPFTPHVVRGDVASGSGTRSGLVDQAWPAADADVAREDELELAVQVNGKVRGRITVAREAGEDEVRRRALAEPKVAEHLAGQGGGEAGGGAGPAGERGGAMKAARAVARRLAGAACALSGCGYALVGRGTVVDPTIKKIGVPHVQRRHRQAGARPEDHPARDRGAAAGAAASTSCRSAAASTPSWKASCCATTPSPSASATEARTAAARHPGQPLRHHADRQHPVREGRRAGADLVQRRLPVPRRVRGRLRPRQLLRPRGAGHRPAGHVVRAQPGGRDARGVLNAAGPARAGVHAVVGADSYLAEQALESAPAGRGRGRPRGRRAGLPRRRDHLGARPRGRAHGIAVRHPPRGGGAQRGCDQGRRRRGRRPTSTIPRPDVALDPDGGEARQAARSPGRRLLDRAQARRRRAAEGPAPLAGCVRDEVRRRKLALARRRARGADRARRAGPAPADGRARQAGGVRRRAQTEPLSADDVSAVLGRALGQPHLPDVGRARRAEAGGGARPSWRSCWTTASPR